MKILVIQQKMIGDVLVSALLAEHIKKELGFDVEVHYMIHTGTKDVVLNNFFIDKIHLFNPDKRKSKKYRKSFIKQLRSESYDILIDAYGKIETALISKLTRVPKRISYFKKYTQFLYTDLVKKSKLSKSNVGLTIEERICLLEPLGIKPDFKTTPKIFITDKEKKEIKSYVDSFGLDNTKKTYMLSVIGSSMDKTYPISYMSELINELADNIEGNFLLNYIPNQIEIAKKIYNNCSEKAKAKIYFDLLGRNLREFIVLMDFCDVIIGNDGGAINIAKALDKPSYIIFSPRINKESWNTYEDGVYHKTVHLKDFNKDIIVKKTPKELKKKSTELYLNFKPSYFKKDLISFVKELEKRDLEKYKLADSVILK